MSEAQNSLSSGMVYINSSKSAKGFPETLFRFPHTSYWPKFCPTAMASYKDGYKCNNLTSAALIEEVVNREVSWK